VFFRVFAVTSGHDSTNTLLAQLSLKEIQDEADSFAKKWQHETEERAESQTFWNDFFRVFGLGRYRVARFEQPASRSQKSTGKAGVFWKGVLLAGHKSSGEDLEGAFDQAMGYYDGLKRLQQPDTLPQYIIVCDFRHFVLHDLKKKQAKPARFELRELHKNIRLFGFMTEYGEREQLKDEEEFAVNVEAAVLLGDLHRQLQASGYGGHGLEVYLVRLLFCLFADDTGIFERGIFREHLYENAKGGGSDMGQKLQEIFGILNTPPKERQKNSPPDLAAFPFINGGLFDGPLRMARFDFSMRSNLMNAAKMDWGAISPAIFGSMFQRAMNGEERRSLGAHCTSEANILKVINPLFLDGLRTEYSAATTKTALAASRYLFGVLTSQMHMAWMRYVCGRLKSDYRYSNTPVYNNYPFPAEASARQRAAVEAAAQAVLDARAQFMPPQGKATPADLYDPLTMPPVLHKAHKALDKAVDACYRTTAFSTDAERVGFLFGLYEAMTKA